MLGAILKDVEKNHVLLDENLSFARTGSLLESIVSKIDLPVELDASQVKHLDAPCGQILLAAKNHCASSGLSFEILNPSEKFKEALSTLGLDHCLLAQMEVS